MSALVISSCGYQLLQTMLDILISPVLMTPSLVDCCLTTTTAEVVNTTNLIYYGPMEQHPIIYYSTSREIWLTDQMILTEFIKPVSTLLNTPSVRSIIDNTIMQKTFDNGMLLSFSFMQGNAAGYREAAEYLHGLSDEYLLSIMPQLREFYLVKQLHIAMLEFGGFPNFNNVVTTLCHSMDLDNVKAINVRLIEAIQRLGSNAGGVSDRELLMRSF